MRKILTYLLGEDAVNGQNDREIREALTGLAMCIALVILLHAIMCICG